MRDLEQLIEGILDFPAPDSKLEQYRTPPRVAAELLWEAMQDGAIKGKHVVDLGCGTGTFCLGATALGASAVTGVEVDPVALDMAREAAPAATFVESNLKDWEPVPADTVIMNPPFGAQYKHADRIFYEKALATGASTIWFLAQPTTQGYLVAMAREAGRSLEKVGEWDYPLPATMDHHREAVKTVRVGGYRLG